MNSSLSGDFIFWVKSPLTNVLLVENLFLKLKNNRRFTTRYEKEALYFRAVVCLAW